MDVPTSFSDKWVIDGFDSYIIYLSKKKKRKHIDYLGLKLCYLEGSK